MAPYNKQPSRKEKRTKLKSNIIKSKYTFRNIYCYTKNTEVYEGNEVKPEFNFNYTNYMIDDYVSTMYRTLKNEAKEAIKNKKIFLLCGPCEPVRQALLARGYVEKIPPERMDMYTLRNTQYADTNQLYSQLRGLILSYHLVRYEPNIVWNMGNTDVDYREDNHEAIYNRLSVKALWTSKIGLSASLRNQHWHYEEGVSEVSCPRTYDAQEEFECFVEDFKLTACISLLKWVLSMMANEKKIFSRAGTIDLNTIVFALNRCKEYLYQIQNKYLDKTSSAIISDDQWDMFLVNYRKLIDKKERFNYDTDDKLSFFLTYAKFLLGEIHSTRPELRIEGCDNVWIIKPANASRGRGIEMASDLKAITKILQEDPTSKIVIQKYIEEPLLIYTTKFDIRIYYLITSTCPLVIWIYKDCYLKFSSQEYTIKNYHKSIHLTNNAVQRYYKNDSNRNPRLPSQNMWTLDSYKKYLRGIGRGELWDKVVFPGIRKSIVGVMLNCQDSIQYCQNRFELYGCDFMIDKDYKPWLLEINYFPDLNPTTEITANLCANVVNDLFKVVLDHAANPKAPTGKFKCIYRQPYFLPRAHTQSRLLIRGSKLSLNYLCKLRENIKGDHGHAEDIELSVIGYNLQQSKTEPVIKVEPETYHDKLARRIVLRSSERKLRRDKTKKNQKTCDSIISESQKHRTGISTWTQS